MVDTLRTAPKIFIGGLSFETTNEMLRAHFSQWGHVTDAVVMKDGASRRSRGFGFISYSAYASVEHALSQLEHIIDGRRVEAKHAVPRCDMMANASHMIPIDICNLPDFDSESHPPVQLKNNCGETSSQDNENFCHNGTKLFVGGLHYETQDNMLKSYFEQFGKVLAADVMVNRETNKSRGFGFVIFDSNESTSIALQKAHHAINGKIVEVKRAVPRVTTPCTSMHRRNTGSPLPIPFHQQHLSYAGSSVESVQNLLAQRIHQHHMQNVARVAAVAAAAAADSYAAALCNESSYPNESSNMHPQIIADSIARNWFLSNSKPHRHSMQHQQEYNDPWGALSAIHNNADGVEGHNRFPTRWPQKGISCLSELPDLSSSSSMAVLHTPNPFENFKSFFTPNSIPSSPQVTNTAKTSQFSDFNMAMENLSLNPLSSTKDFVDEGVRKSKSRWPTEFSHWSLDIFDRISVNDCSGTETPSDENEDALEEAKSSSWSESKLPSYHALFGGSNFSDISQKNTLIEVCHDSIVKRSSYLGQEILALCDQDEIIIDSFNSPKLQVQEMNFVFAPYSTTN